MRRQLVNPNHDETPVKITDAEFNRVAKSGHKPCGGRGFVALPMKPSEPSAPSKTQTGQPPEPTMPPEKKFMLCNCTNDLVAGRKDIAEIDGTLYWLPVPAAAPAAKVA